MKLIDREDLDQDPVVRFQHKHYLPLTVGLGLVAPTILGSLWGDVMGGFVWGGLVARLFSEFTSRRLENGGGRGRARLADLV